MHYSYYCFFIAITVIIHAIDIVVIARRRGAALPGPRRLHGAQGKILHTRNHKHEVPLKNATENPR